MSGLNCDVFIAGSGPIGATYARLLVEGGYRVIMADVGEQEGPYRGSHKRNFTRYRIDMNKFVHINKADLTLTSIPPYDEKIVKPALMPAERVGRHGLNREQDEFKNLSSNAVVRIVGGMSTHWTCAVPRFQDFELDELVEFSGWPEEEWSRLYKRAEDYIGRGIGQFDYSIRHQAILQELNTGADKHRFSHTPLAATRKNDNYVEWHSVRNVFDLEERNTAYASFHLLTNTRCTSLNIHTNQNQVSKVTAARLTDLNTGSEIRVTAKFYILATGSLCNPQILVNSLGNEVAAKLMPNLGRYITSPTISFSQITLSPKVYEKFRADFDQNCELKEPPHQNPGWWNAQMIEHRRKDIADELWIPRANNGPQMMSPPTKDRPWHSMILRESFTYLVHTGGDTTRDHDITNAIDDRLVMDLSWWRGNKPIHSNRLFFSETWRDDYAMPQPTFEYERPLKDEEIKQMQDDMVNIQEKIGECLPNTKPGVKQSTFHLGSSHRSGSDDKKGESVVDKYSRVWDFDNLFLGGVGNIPIGFCTPPTLTAMAYAIKSCDYILGQLRTSDDPDRQPTAFSPERYPLPTES